MAKCANCGYALKFTDWKPECPKCGVNLNYFKANEILLAESEKAEAEHAKFQPKVDRAKAAYAGSIFAILRIIFTLLPIAGLFLPLCRYNGESVNALWLYNYLSKADIGALFGKIPVAVCLVTLLLSAVMMIICLVFIVMSLGKHGKGRTIALYAVMPVCAVISAVCYTVISSDMADSAVSYGAFVYIALQLFSFGWNLFVVKKGIPVKYTPCIVGGLPSDEYFGYVNSGMPLSEIRRKMLVALTKLQIEAEAKEEATEEAAV
ncbi:MAG: hypothetical protein J1E34_02120 [Oscillospiraceae bacterium]|nr:hypothetical protein [Oscillospiraceae bacterium]